MFLSFFKNLLYCLYSNLLGQIYHSSAETDVIT